MNLFNYHKNLLENFLDELEVSYTRMYADKLYNEHPHRNDMYGLNAMCAIYGLKTIGVSVVTKDFANLTYPCILHIPNAFVIAISYDATTITYLIDGQKKTCSCPEFKDLWTGKALIVTEVSEAVEPNYKENVKKQILSIIALYSSPLIFILSFLIGGIKNIRSGAYSIEAAAVISMFGVIICTMLLNKQLYGTSRYGDKVCSFWSHANCNNILERGGAKILGFSWSEIGLGFFMSNVCLLSLSPLSVSAVALINWIAMFFAIWSIYYQWKIAKSWCILCLITQIIIWSAALVLMLWHIKYSFSFNCYYAIISCIVYCWGIILVHDYSEKVKATKEYLHTCQQYKSLKVNKLVAKTLLEHEKYFPTSLNDSKILFGNPHSDLLITILSNPHCPPCARLHKKIEHILDTYGDKICIQYIFSSFGSNLDDSCRYLISMYNTRNLYLTREVYSDWYKYKKENYKEIIRQNQKIIHQIKVEEEWKRHCKWCQVTKISATPTILLNGYILPKEYNLEDVILLSDVIFKNNC